MSTDAMKYTSLIDELEMSHELIKSGFGSLQEINIANNIYQTSHQLMASGFGD